MNLFQFLFGWLLRKESDVVSPTTDQGQIDFDNEQRAHTIQFLKKLVLLGLVLLVLAAAGVLYGMFNNFIPTPALAKPAIEVLHDKFDLRVKSVIAGDFKYTFWTNEEFDLSEGYYGDAVLMLKEGDFYFEYRNGSNILIVDDANGYDAGDCEYDGANDVVFEPNVLFICKIDKNGLGHYKVTVMVTGDPNAQLQSQSEELNEPPTTDVPSEQENIPEPEALISFEHFESGEFDGPYNDGSDSCDGTQTHSAIEITFTSGEIAQVYLIQESKAIIVLKKTDGTIVNYSIKESQRILMGFNFRVTNCKTYLQVSTLMITDYSMPACNNGKISLDEINWKEAGNDLVLNDSVVKVTEKDNNRIFNVTSPEGKFEFTLEQDGNWINIHSYPRSFGTNIEEGHFIAVALNNGLVVYVYTAWTDGGVPNTNRYALTPEGSVPNGCRQP